MNFDLFMPDGPMVDDRGLALEAEPMPGGFHNAQSKSRLTYHFVDNQAQKIRQFAASEGAAYPTVEECRL
jgi:hypothetical protein